MHHPRKKIPDSTKKHLLWKQQYRCNECQAELDDTFETDHKRALFLGGTNDCSNLQILCPACHRWKTKMERQVIVQKKNEIRCRMCQQVFSPWFQHVCPNWEVIKVPNCKWSRTLSEKWKYR